MDRKFWAVLLVIGCFGLFGASVASAHEGRFTLKNSDMACEGISLWKDSHYRLVGRCSGLTYPFQERLDNYVLWTKSGTANPKKVGSVNLGYFDGYAQEPFDQIILSVEGNGYSNKPGEIVLASGDIQGFNFSTSNGTPVVVAPIIATPTPTPAVIAKNINASTLSTGLKRGAAAIAIIVGVVIAFAVAMLIVRRSN